MTTSKLILAQAALVLGVAASALLADGLAGTPTHDLSWHTIDSGGGTSANASYSLTGTIGQPDASTTTLAGGSYTLDGGFWPGAIPIEDCPTDITNDNTINVLDLLAVITTWGACPMPCPPNCNSDIAPIGGPTNGDCQVNVLDLLAVITTWGPCP